MEVERARGRSNGADSAASAPTRMPDFSLSRIFCCSGRRRGQVTTSLPSAPRATTATACGGAAPWQPLDSRGRWRLVWHSSLSEEVRSPPADWSRQRKRRGESPRPKDFSFENSLFGQAERVPFRSPPKPKPLVQKRPATWLAAQPIGGQCSNPNIRNPGKRL